MTPTIFLALTVAVPAALIIVLRSDAAIVLLSLCAGSLLVQYIGNDAASLVANNTHNSNPTGIAYIALLLIPALLSIVALRKSVSSVKLPFNVVTAIAAGVVGVMLITPLISGHFHDQITSSFVWGRLQQYQSTIIAASIALALVGLWLGGHKHSRGHNKHH